MGHGRSTQINAGVAQLIEQRSCKAKVGGLSPLIGSTYKGLTAREARNSCKVSVEGSMPSRSIKFQKGTHHAKSQGPGLHVSGKTVEGKPVVQGVFYITSTIGLPLEIILDTLTKQGMVIDWKDFYEDSFKNGQKPDRIIMRIESAVGDCFGPKYREEVSRRLLGLNSKTD